LRFHLYIAAALTSAFLQGAGVAAERSSPSEPIKRGSETQLFAAPDDSAAVLEMVQNGAGLSPLAETVASGGTKWYLVQSQSGTAGWIKASDSDPSKKVEGFFKSLPTEPVVFAPIDRDSSASKRPQDITVPVDIRGSKVMVLVTFNQNVTANLALDTAAGTTLISRRIARSLGLYASVSRRISGVTGSAIASVSGIESVKLGEAEVRNFQVDIHDMPGGGEYEGLLGMDFLRQFQLSLDTQKKLLILSPR
jgi:Aspartyl protease